MDTAPISNLPHFPIHDLPIFHTAMPWLPTALGWQPQVAFHGGIRQMIATP